MSLILVFKGLSVSIVRCHLVEDTIQLISLDISCKKGIHFCCTCSP